MLSNGENLSQDKNPPGDFKVTTPENSLLSQQAITSKWIIVPYTNLKLNSCPNTQLDLFYSDNLSFLMHSSQYMTNQSMCGSQYSTYTPTWERYWLQSFSVHHTMKITKLLDYKTLRCINTAASWIEKWTKAYVSDSQYACEKPLHQVALTCINCDAT